MIRVEVPKPPEEIVVNDGSVPESDTTNNVFKIERELRSDAEVMVSGQWSSSGNKDLAGHCITGQYCPVKSLLNCI